jgi:hypothetical protein
MAIYREKKKRTLHMKRLSIHEMRINALVYPERVYWRPRTRADCANVGRPCPYVACRHHLYLDANERTGSVKTNHEGEVWEMRETCSLDVADQGPHELSEIGGILGVTHQRITQIVQSALEKLKKANALTPIVWEHQARGSEAFPIAPDVEVEE